MQFRIRGGKEEYLRSSYDPAKKRSVQKLVQLGDLTPEELEQLEEWRRKTSAEQLAKARDLQLGLAPIAINEIADALEHTEHVTGTGLYEASLFQALDRLQKAMRKAGIKRPPKPAKQQGDTLTAPLNLD